MPATRTYQITADDLKRLHGFAQESIATLVCVRGDPPCGMENECEQCLAKHLLEMLADAVILNAAGADIILTTQLQSAEKAEEGTIH
jgi:hypothetical protein